MNLQKLAGITSLVCYTLLFATCHSGPSVVPSLNQAKDNRPELETLLNHYNDDPEKQQAARFLVGNMDAHYTIESEAAQMFRADVDTLFARKGLEVADYQSAFDSLFKRYQTNEKKLTKEWDTEHLTADFLIAHIDSAFKVWREDPWVGKYSMEHFCNYVLPYRIGHEPVSLWHERYRKISMAAVKGYSNVQENRHHKYGIYGKVKGDLKPSNYFADGYIPELSLTSIPATKVGSCEIYTAYCVTLLRAFGLPAAIDFTPQWGNRSMGHSWAVYLPEEGDFLPFAPDEPMGHHFFRRQTEYLPKVFRRTFAKQSEMKELIRNCNGALPQLFSTPCLIDVTDDYIATSDIDVPLFPEVKDKVIYLTVFDNRQWRVVHYGYRKGDRAHFSQMGRNIAYLPVAYTEEGTLLPAGHPFILHPNGRMQTLQTDTVQTENVTLLRKYKTSPALTENYDPEKSKFCRVERSDYHSQYPLTKEYRFEPATIDEYGNFKLKLEVYGPTWSYLMFISEKKKWYSDPCTYIPIMLYPGDKIDIQINHLDGDTKREITYNSMKKKDLSALMQCAPAIYSKANPAEYSSMSPESVQKQFDDNDTLSLYLSGKYGLSRLETEMLRSHLSTVTAINVIKATSTNNYRTHDDKKTGLSKEEKQKIRKEWRDSDSPYYGLAFANVRAESNSFMVTPEWTHLFDDNLMAGIPHFTKFKYDFMEKRIQAFRKGVIVIKNDPEDFVYKETPESRKSTKDFENQEVKLEHDGRIQLIRRWRAKGKKKDDIFEQAYTLCRISSMPTNSDAMRTYKRFSQYRELFYHPSFIRIAGELLWKTGRKHFQRVDEQNF